MPYFREAFWAEAPMDADGDCRFWMVGQAIICNGTSAIVTHITVEDMPGPNGELRRVCVWVNNDLVAEAPVHMLAAIGYELPKPGEPDALHD